MELSQAINKRVSNRYFNKQKIDKDKINDILEHRIKKQDKKDKLRYRNYKKVFKFFKQI